MNDRVVVVTGAGSGIGRSTARAFAASGAQVVLVGRRLEPLVATGAGEPLVAEVADVSAAERIVEFARLRYRRIWASWHHAEHGWRRCPQLGRDQQEVVAGVDGRDAEVADCAQAARPSQASRTTWCGRSCTWPRLRQGS